MVAVAEKDKPHGMKEFPANQQRTKVERRPSEILRSREKLYHTYAVRISIEHKKLGKSVPQMDPTSETPHHASVVAGTAE